jgi:hypothetical protein
MGLAFYAHGAAITIASSLPSLGNPTILPIAAAIGAFLGATLGRLRRQPREEIHRLAEDGGYFTFALAAIIYLLGLVTNVY